jgi:hypothetical protein
MSVTKNTLLVFLSIIIVVLFLYLYSGSIIDSIVKEKISFNDWPVKNNPGWVSTIFTFALGVCTGWLLFRRAK